jgi:hypothetical protein
VLGAVRSSLALLLLASCNRELYLPPVPVDAGTEILLVDGAIEYFDLSEPFAHRFELRGETSIQAMVFDVSPEEVRLSDEWTFEAGGAPKDDVYRKFRGANDPLGWAELDAPTDPMRAIRLPTPCAQVELAWTEPAPVNFEPIGLVSRPDGTAILAARNLLPSSFTTHFFTVTPEGEFVDLDFELDGWANFAFGAPDGRIVLAGNGDYAIGDPESGFTIAARTSTTVERMFDSIMDEDGIIFGFSENDRLYRIDGSTWTVILEPTGPSTCRSNQCRVGQLALIAPGELFAISRATAHLVHWKDGAWTQAVTEIDGELDFEVDHLLSIRHLPPLGMFVGTLLGRVLTRDPDGVFRIVRQGARQWGVRVFHPLESGSLLITGDTLVDQYDRIIDCSEARLELEGRYLVESAVSIDAGVLIYGGMADVPHLVSLLRFSEP